MGLTAWSVLLALAGSGGFFGRRRWLARKERNRIHAAKKKAAAAQAELDRLACLDLGRSLTASAPGMDEPSPAKDRRQN